MGKDNDVMASTDLPSEIRVIDQGRKLSMMFANGDMLTLPADLLRIATPSADAQGAQAENTCSVAIIGIEPVGNYAVQLAFDDGHSSGLYSWELLRSLASPR